VKASPRRPNGEPEGDAQRHADQHLKPQALAKQAKEAPATAHDWRTAVFVVCDGVVVCHGRPLHRDVTGHIAYNQMPRRCGGARIVWTPCARGAFRRLLAK